MRTSGSISIESMRADAIADALALWGATEGLTLRGADEPAALARFLERNPGLSLVAVQEGRVAGAVLCGHDGRRGYIHHLAVAADVRRRGIGRALVDAALAGLSRDGITKCHLFVRIDNPAAARFWTTLGWQLREDVWMYSWLGGSDANA